MYDCIKELVKEQYGKMNPSNKYSNSSKLYGICSKIIYNNWGIYNNNIDKMLSNEILNYYND